MPYKEMEGLCSFSWLIILFVFWLHLTYILMPVYSRSGSRFPSCPPTHCLQTEMKRQWYEPQQQLTERHGPQKGRSCWLCAPESHACAIGFVVHRSYPCSRVPCSLLHWIAWLVLAIAWFCFVWLSTESLNLPFSQQSSHGICLH